MPRLLHERFQERSLIMQPFSHYGLDKLDGEAFCHHHDAHVKSNNEFWFEYGPWIIFMA